MLTGLTADLAVVMVLELSRHAVERAASGEMSPALRAHVWASTAAILCYLGAVTLGTVFLRGRRDRIIRWHRRLGWVAITARSAGFVTMLAASEASAREILLLAALPLAAAAAAWSRYRAGHVRLSAPAQRIRQSAAHQRQP
jgi:hypothetical protein